MEANEFENLKNNIMKNEQQRIWNKSELEANPDRNKGEDGDWTKTMDLRWWSNPKLGTLNYLQQKHISNLENEKWVDVESVTI